MPLSYWRRSHRGIPILNLGAPAMSDDSQNPFDFLKDAGQRASSAASRMRKQTGVNPVVLLAIGVPAVFLFGSCLCCGVCGLIGGGDQGGTVAREDESDDVDQGSAVTNTPSQVEIADFIDNTSNYQGHVIEFEMRHTTARNNEAFTLRERVGSWAKFYLSDSGFRRSGAKSDVFIDIPPDISVPNIDFAENAVVRFRCEQGSLSDGNVAISIRRP